MSKTPFSDKCQVLGGLWLYYREQAAENEAWRNFFDYNDVALPLSYMYAEGLVRSVTAQGKEMIEETWLMFCDYILIDPDGQYSTIADAFDASNQPPLENE